MKYKVIFTSSAKRSIKKIDIHDRNILLKWIKNNLEGIECPYDKGKALKGNLRRYWRYRCGQFRIITEIRDSELLILVVEIGNRKEIYQKSSSFKKWYINEVSTSNDH